jgi:hypothetical protein
MHVMEDIVSLFFPYLVIKDVALISLFSCHNIASAVFSYLFPFLILAGLIPFQRSLSHNFLPYIRDLLV